MVSKSPFDLVRGQNVCNHCLQVFACLVLTRLISVTQTDRGISQNKYTPTIHSIRP